MLLPEELLGDGLLPVPVLRGAGLVRVDLVTRVEGVSPRVCDLAIGVVEIDPSGVSDEKSDGFAPAEFCLFSVESLRVWCLRRAELRLPWKWIDVIGALTLLSTVEMGRLVERKS